MTPAERDALNVALTQLADLIRRQGAAYGAADEWRRNFGAVVAAYEALSRERTEAARQAKREAQQ